MLPASADEPTHGPSCLSCGQPLGFRTTDKLTGLLDRWAWDQAVAEILDQVGDQPAVLLMIDLDRFKDVNDTHGHLAGDVVLRAAASVIRGAVRQMDIVGRYGGHGGDEFLVLLPATDRERGEKVAARILAQVRAVTVSAPSARDGIVTLTGLTASIGLAVRERNADHDLMALFQGADAALLRAKHTGRDRVATAAVSVSDVPPVRLLRRRHLEEVRPATSVAESTQDGVAERLRALRMLAALSVGPVPYRDLADVDGTPAATVGHLERAGLVACDRDGDTILCCSLTPAARELLDKLLPAIELAGEIGSSTGARGV